MAATTPTNPDLNAPFPNPDQYQGRDNIVPKQVDKEGKSIITGELPQTALDVFQAQQVEAAEPDFDWKPEAVHVKVSSIAKPVLPPAHDPDAPINWNYNPQDDYVPAGRPATKAPIASFTPGLKDYNPYDPEPRLEDGLQPDFAWDPSKEIPMSIVKPAPAKPVLPPKDDIEANMANIWTPDPVYTTGKGTRP